MSQPDATGHEKYELMCALAAAHELDSTEQPEFEQHLTECEACRGEVAGFRQVVDQLADGRATTSVAGLDEERHAKSFQTFARAEGLSFSKSARQALTGRTSPAWQPRIVFAAAVVLTVAGGAILLIGVQFASRSGSSRPTSTAARTPAPADTSSNREAGLIAELESRLAALQKEAGQIPVLASRARGAEERRLRLEVLMAEREREIAELRAAAVDSQKRVAGEFILMPPLVFRTGRDNAAASDRF